MEQVLHLFITNRCRHNCPLCCNKLYKIDEIPVITVELLKSVQTVCLTGGEPFSIDSNVLVPFIKNLRDQYKNIKNLYIYTSGKELYSILKYRELMDSEYINGINIAPKDWEDWLQFASLISKHFELFSNIFYPYKKASNRLYVFKEQEPIFNALNLDLNTINIDVISRKWDRTFNTPENEHFCRLSILF